MEKTEFHLNFGPDVTVEQLEAFFYSLQLEKGSKIEISLPPDI